MSDLIEYYTVSEIPEKDAMLPGELYHAPQYQIAAHLCACGCGCEVVTPIKDGEWSLTLSGEKVTLTPSIGNFKYPCESHYFITDGKVKWC